MFARSHRLLLWLLALGAWGSGLAQENSAARHDRRAHLRQALGGFELRIPAISQTFINCATGAVSVAERERFLIERVRWPVLDGVYGEGLWLRPRGETVARVVLLCGVDDTPERVAGLVDGSPPDRQYARRLAENGCEVIVPFRLGWPPVANSLLREIRPGTLENSAERRRLAPADFNARSEVQAVLAAFDLFMLRPPHSSARPLRLGVAGFHEGGWLALCSAAVEPRIQAAMVSGSFHAQPGRSVSGLGREFGPAELASQLAGRSLIVEHSPAAAGFGTPDYEAVENEFERARSIFPGGNAKDFEAFVLVSGTEGMATGPGSDRALAALLKALGAPGRRLRP